jgi:hypothetical protein
LTGGNDSPYPHLRVQPKDLDLLLLSDAPSGAVAAEVSLWVLTIDDVVNE